MRESLEPDLITYNAAIIACGKAKQPEIALGLLAEMQNKGLDPDVIAYSAAISACERASQPERSLDLPAEIGRPERHHIQRPSAHVRSQTAGEDSGPPGGDAEKGPGAERHHIQRGHQRM